MIPSGKLPLKNLSKDASLENHFSNKSVSDKDMYKVLGISNFKVIFIRNEHLVSRLTQLCMDCMSVIGSLLLRLCLLSNQSGSNTPAVNTGLTLSVHL